jgi:hypothetical protein
MEMKVQIAVLWVVTPYSGVGYVGYVDLLLCVPHPWVSKRLRTCVFRESPVIRAQVQIVELEVVTLHGR